jgi:TonB family protein
MINAMLTGLAFFLLAAGTPAPMPSAPCDRESAVIKQAQPAVTDAALNTITGQRQATIAVTIEPSGRVVSASVYQSSGVPFLDAAALDAAKRSTYAPGQTNCAASGGTFALAFSFVGTAKEQCPRDVTVLSLAETPERERIIGTAPVAVQVTVSADGRLTEAAIVTSSGSLDIDRAAIEVARFSTYAPQLIAVAARRQAEAGQAAPESAVECRPVAGKALLKFNAGR